MKKNHLKILLIVFGIGLFANNLFSQQAYVGINTGYGINLSSSTAVNYSYTSSGLDYSGSWEAVNMSMGKGFNAGFSFGYMFNENIGAELGVSYLIGGKTKTVIETNYDASHSTTDYTSHSNMLRFIPSLVIASGLAGFNPYAKFGLVVGTASLITKSEGNEDGDITVEEWKYNGGVALGLSSGIGARFKLSDKMSFFGEFNMVNLSYAPTKGKATKVTYNGIDKLPDLKTREKEIEFVDSYSYDSNISEEDSQPSKELKQKFPFGSLGVNIGLRVNL